MECVKNGGVGVWIPSGTLSGLPGPHLDSSRSREAAGDQGRSGVAREGTAKDDAEVERTPFGVNLAIGTVAMVSGTTTAALIPVTDVSARLVLVAAAVAAPVDPLPWSEGGPGPTSSTGYSTTPNQSRRRGTCLICCSCC